MTEKTDRPSAEIRIRAMKRDRFMCTYCGASGNDAELEIDHIIPVSKGGSNHISNLTTACKACNMKKSNKSEEDFKRDRTLDYSPLVGLWLHTLCDEYIQNSCLKQIQNQGEIIADGGDYVVVRIFEWLMGEPSGVKIIKKNFLFDYEKVRLYESSEAMRRFYDMYYANKMEAK
jgi:hypothetical protein